MVEPWVTPWSRCIYRTVHHEPFDPNAKAWELTPGHPLTQSNNALAWILFQRDRQQFEQRFPEWRIEKVRPFMPLRYLLSGGTTGPTLMPGWTFALWTWLEALTRPLWRWTGLFCLIVLQRQSTPRCSVATGTETGTDA